jgi:GT2 family glycosyltransferase
MNKVAIVIASWNTKKNTLETLESVAKSDTPNFSIKVIVVDNGSVDGSGRAIEKFIAEYKGNKNISWKLIINRVNTGYCEGNNKGIKYALGSKADYIMLLNDDVVIDRELIVRLIEFAKRHPELGAVTPKIYFAKGYEFRKKYRKSDLGRVFWYAGGDMDWDNIYGSNHGVDEVDKGQYDKAREIDFASGCCVLFPSKVIKKVGFLDKKYFAYLEDADISQRMKSEGFKVYYYPKAFMWHKVSQSSGVGSDLNDYFLTRNRMLFGLRYAKIRTKLALIKESFRLLISGREWQKKGVLDFYLGNFEMGSWGNK